MARKITMEKLIIANWKTYLSIEDAIYLSQNISEDTNVIIAPAIAHLAYLTKKFPKLNFAAQDISAITSDYGAYTGETPSILLKDLGVKHAIIGHSERRSNMLDNLSTITTKLQYCLKNEITPIVCIGETIEDRKKKIHLDVVSNQLLGIFDNLEIKNNNSIIIAYEPFWSVGTGVLPSSLEIEEVINLVRKTVNFVDNRLFLVYGGGVSTENIYNLMNLEGLDGFLVGKASTNAQQFNSILNKMR